MLLSAIFGLPLSGMKEDTSYRRRYARIKYFNALLIWSKIRIVNLCQISVKLLDVIFISAIYFFVRLMHGVKNKNTLLIKNQIQFL